MKGRDEMINKTEFLVIERVLEAPRGSLEEIEALDELTSLYDTAKVRFKRTRIDARATEQSEARNGS